MGGDWQYLVYMMRQDVEFLATNVNGVPVRRRTGAKLAVSVNPFRTEAVMGNTEAISRN